MMFYEVLCLKSILGFLLSEHTSGVSGGGSFEKLFDNYVSTFNFCVVRRVGIEQPLQKKWNGNMSVIGVACFWELVVANNHKSVFHPPAGSLPRILPLTELKRTVKDKKNGIKR